MSENEETRHKTMPLAEIFDRNKSGDQVVASVRIVRTAEAYRGKSPQDEMICLQWVLRRHEEGLNAAPCILCHEQIKADEDGVIMPGAFFLLADAAKDREDGRKLAITCLCEPCSQIDDEEIARKVLGPTVQHTFKPGNLH